jgi:REP element-mobilizing transposase RayT
MKYDPKKHHHRSIRLKGYDYASPGWYYVTICTCEREFSFGEIVRDQMHPSEIGAIVQECWNEIPQHFRRASLDVSIVMPNHLHGVVIIGGDVPSRTGTLGTGTPWRAPTNSGVPVRAAAFGKPVLGWLATMVGLFKQAVTRRVRARHGVPLQVWQDNFYEYIIRNEKELNRIREYICNNPLRWAYDSENPARDPEAVDEIEDILGTEDDPDR